MNVAFVTRYDPKDIRRGSGTFYCMRREMMRQGHHVHYIGSLEDLPRPVIPRVLKYLSRKFGKTWLPYLDPFIGQTWGREVSDQLADLDFDVLITNEHCIAAYVETTKPVVLYTDVMFLRKYSENIHPWHANISWINVWPYQHVTAKALQRCSLCVFPARWAVDEAIKYGVIGEERLVVIPFGANMDDPTDSVVARRCFDNVRKKSVMNLLFVGKDWALKGGDIAIKTVLELRRRGIEAVLHVVGSVPSCPVDSSSIRTWGLLDKSNANQKAKLDQLYRSSDVLILPSVCEGFVIAALEAAAYGLPVLGYDTRGVTDAVKNGDTGILMNPGDSEGAFANAIQAWFDAPWQYDRLVAGARKHYEETVNWKTAVSTLFAEIRKHLEL